MIMEDKLLNEINRFRELSKLPLLTEGWADNLARRIPSLDSIISKLGYTNKNLTDDEIDIIINELKKSTKGLSDDALETLRGWLKEDEVLRKGLTKETDNFVGKLKGLEYVKSTSLGGFDAVVKLTDEKILNITKTVVNNLFNLETSNLMKGFNKVDSDISSGLELIYNDGYSLHSIDEVYNIFDGRVNRILSKNKVDDVIGDEILQLFKTRARTNSKTKELLDKFNLENRSLDRKPRVGEVSNYDNNNILPAEWDPSDTWVGERIKPNKIPNSTDNLFSGAKIDANILNTYAELKKTLKTLKEELQNTKADDVGVGELKEKIKNIENYLNSLNKGVTTKTDTIFDDLNGYFNPRQIEQIRIRLENPSPIEKIGNVSSIFWSVIEPIRQKYRELLKSSNRYDSIISTISSKKRPSTTQEYLDDFMESLQSVQLNFNKNLTDGQIKALKDKFVRLKSNGYEGTYETLWNDLNSFMESNLDVTAKKEWVEIQKQLMAENPSNWRWLTWKEIVNDEIIVTKFERNQKDLNPINPFTVKKDIVLPMAVLDNTQKWIRENHGFLTNFVLTGNLKTPKQFKMELVKNGYARKGMIPYAGGKFKSRFSLSAAGKNFVQQWLLKYIYIPLGFCILEYIVNGFINGSTTTDWGDDIGTLLDRIQDTLFSNWLPQKIDEDLKEASPEWYDFLSPIMDWSTDSPALKMLKTTAEGKLLDFKTPEEKDLEMLDKVISDVEESLKNKPPKLLVSDFERWKRIINETMVNRRLLTKEMAKLVTDNMSIKYNVDTDVVNRLKQSIKDAHSDDSIIEKGKEITKIMNGTSLNDSAIEDIVVTTPNGVFKLINEGGQIGIMYIDPSYEELKKDNTLKKTKKPLNELKFK